jgi:hypothetical protein
MAKNSTPDPQSTESLDPSSAIAEVPSAIAEDSVVEGEGGVEILPAVEAVTEEVPPPYDPLIRYNDAYALAQSLVEAKKLAPGWVEARLLSKAPMLYTNGMLDAIEQELAAFG